MVYNTLGSDPAIFVLGGDLEVLHSVAGIAKSLCLIEAAVTNESKSNIPPIRKDVGTYVRL